MTLALQKVELLDGGAEAFPRMLAAIEAARQSVHLESYIFRRDAIGRDFMRSLTSAAHRGVRVTVVLDGWGSRLQARPIAAALRLAGVDVRIHNPLAALLFGRVLRNHRKLLLVDEQVAFVGGLNIGDEYAATSMTRPQRARVRIGSPLTSRKRTRCSSRTWACEACERGCWR